MAGRPRRASRAAAAAFALVSGTVTLLLVSLALLRPGQPERAWLVLERRRVPVARDAATLPLLDDAVQGHDRTLLDALEAEGLVFTVAPHRRVAILAHPPADQSSVAIQIREGALRGETGWVRRAWLSLEPPDGSPR